MDTELSVSNGKWETLCYTFHHSSLFRELEEYTRFPHVYMLISCYGAPLHGRSISEDRQNWECP